MKTTIITTLLAVGMLLRPQPTPVVNNGGSPDNHTAVTSAQQALPQAMNAADMNAAVGSGLTGCFQTKTANGDVYVTCCLDLWIFAICIGVNWSAIERVIPFI